MNNHSHRLPRLFYLLLGMLLGALLTALWHARTIV
jgi:hypothetical protein